MTEEKIMIVRFKNIYHNSDFKIKVINSKKKEFYRELAKASRKFRDDGNKSGVMIYE